ncbi:MAG: sigma-70 family RNA polymerase sigma factor [Bacteroidota bacterium]|nr:sigma-70 family RNA polymerase sigma factor [Bacteroidota bacterium]
MLYERNLLVREEISCSFPSNVFGIYNNVDYGKLSDKLVWEAFKRGDELAFAHIYKVYSNILYNYGCQFSQDKEMVRDCLQDFFLYLKKNGKGFGETNSIKMYLFKAFKRRVIDYHKKCNSEFRLHKMFAFSQFTMELSSESKYINQQIKAEQLEKLNKALKTLDSKERDAIYYFYYKGLSYEKIAEILNFSHVSSARRIMYRSLRHLRNSLCSS